MTFWKAVSGLINDTTARNLRADSITNTLQTIEFEHRQIHSGNHFFIKTWTDITNQGTIKYFMFVSPNTTTTIHARAYITAEDEFRVEIYEGAITSANGTGVTALNNYRDSATTATLSCYVDPTVTNDGTRIWDTILGAGKSIGVSSQSNYEIVAKKNTKYLFKITKNNAGTHYVDVDFWWYEHVPIN